MTTMGTQVDCPTCGGSGEVRSHSTGKVTVQQLEETQKSRQEAEVRAGMLAEAKRLCLWLPKGSLTQVIELARTLKDKATKP
jgi:hypothetical protein